MALFNPSSCQTKTTYTKRKKIHAISSNEIKRLIKKNTFELRFAIKGDSLALKW